MYIFRHVALAIFHVPLLVAFLKLIQWNRISSFFLDFFLLILPFLLICTVCNQFLHWTGLLFAVATWWLYRSRCHEHNGDKYDKSFAATNVGTSSHQFLTLFKGSNMLATCVCILAVDFTVIL